MATVDGSTTLYRGASGDGERHDLVLTFALKAGETVYKGQALSLDQDTNNSSDEDSLNGVVQTPSGDDVVIVGVCLDNVDDSDTSENEYGKRRVSVLIKGITKMRCLVNATGTSDGYEIPIKVGGLAYAAGDGCTVSGFTSLKSGAYAIAAGSTDNSDTYPIGWFLDSQDGSSTDETISNGTATIANSQAADTETWVRVYVDCMISTATGVNSLSV